MLHRKFSTTSLAVAILAVTALLVGCGGGSKESAPVNNATVMPPASPMTAVQKEISALPLATAALIPLSLKCKTTIVWVNTARKTYHESSDPYYGRTKHGEYMCKEAAEAAGDHLAGTRHPKKGKGMGGDGSGGVPTPASYNT